MAYKINDELPEYEVIAENYARQSENKIHSPEVAQKLGFTGGLVPGVGIYTYMTQPLITHLGTDWLGKGVLNAKFLKPVYEGEKIVVQSKITLLEPFTVEMEVINEDGVLCAVGTGGLCSKSLEPKITDYPPHPVPELRDRYPARADAIEIDSPVGSIPVEYHPGDLQVYFFKKHRDLIPALLIPEPMHHPALLLHIANSLTHYNIKLGPWIHTSSEVQHINLPVMSENMQLNGKIMDTYKRRGHDFVVLDLAVFTDTSKPIARIKHTAIIRPRGV